MFLKITINNTYHIITNLCNKYSEMLPVLTSHAETASVDFWFYFFFHALVMLVSSVLYIYR